MGRILRVADLRGGSTASEYEIEPLRRVRRRPRLGGPLDRLLGGQTSIQARLPLADITRCSEPKSFCTGMNRRRSEPLTEGM